VRHCTELVNVLDNSYRAVMGLDEVYFHGEGDYKRASFSFCHISACVTVKCSPTVLSAECVKCFSVVNRICAFWVGLICREARPAGLHQWTLEKNQLVNLLKPTGFVHQQV
jgi:hypothetical protein